MRRSLPVQMAAALAAVALLGTGCGGSSPRSDAPAASSTVTVATPRADPPPKVGGPYGSAASAVHEDSVYPDIGEPSVDALHYAISLRWDKDHRRLRATTRIRFRAVATADQVRLDLSARLTPSKVALDGAPATFDHPGKDLLVHAKVTKDHFYTLRVDYAGHPAPEPAPTTRDDTPSVGWTTLADGEVRSMQEPYGAYTWYPVNDQPADKAFYDVRIDAPGPWVGVSNGKLVSRSTKAGRTVTSWRLTHPAASYLVTVAIGPYREHTDTGPRGLPISYWVRPQDDAVLPILRGAPAAISWLEARLGPLPSDRMGFVVVPQASGMETQDMITLGIRNMRSDDGQTVVHELAHQWYGDALTPSDWRDVWMNEGMATYLQQEWAVDERNKTWTEFEAQTKGFDRILRAEYGPPGDFKRGQFAQANVYYCPALMWRTLRTRIGADAFDRLRRDWIQDHLFQSADRAELADWWSAKSGKDLHAFFTEWLTSKTTPRT